jgi:1-acyl-sn-glycerol-3-phosphate acyltransferase
MTDDLTPVALTHSRPHLEKEEGSGARTLTHRIVTSTIKQVTRIICQVDDTQLARVPAHGPLILITNHVNFLEVPVLYTHLQPRPVTGFVKAENLNHPFLGPLLFRVWEGIPLERGEADIQAFRQALQALDEGRILAVAPEGTRSGHGRLQQGHPGTAFVALRSGAPILPIAFYGGEAFWNNMSHLRRTNFHITVGRPFYVNASGVRVTREIRHQMADEIMYQLAALLPPAYRGFYSDLRQASETYLRFSPNAASNLRHA